MTGEALDRFAIAVEGRWGSGNLGGGVKHDGWCLRQAMYRVVATGLGPRVRAEAGYSLEVDAARAFSILGEA